MVHRTKLVRRSLVLPLLLLAATAAGAAEPNRGIEDALTAARDAKRGINLYVNGQVIGGAVVRLEPGAFVELRNQEFGRIVVRLDRIDAVAMP